VKHFFDQHDVSNTGTLNRAEFVALLRDLGCPSSDESFVAQVLVQLVQLDALEEEDDPEDEAQLPPPASSEVRVTLHEVQRWWDAFDVEQVFLSFDKDGSGDVDDSELAVLVQTLGVSMAPKQLKQAMQELDADESGTLSFDEFLPWWKSMQQERALQTTADSIQRKMHPEGSPRRMKLSAGGVQGARGARGAQPTEAVLRQIAKRYQLDADELVMQFGQ
jgi:Ca2+-binding EF-hand superfamily protein